MFSRGAIASINGLVPLPNINRRFLLELWIARMGALLDLLAGFIFSWTVSSLDLSPWELALYPVLIGVRGSVVGIFVGRLSTALQIGTVEPVVSRDNYGLMLLVGADYFLAVVSCFMIAVYALATGPILAIPIHSVLYVSLLSMALSVAAMAPLVTMLSITAFQRGWNTDIILFPVTAALADVIVTALYALALLASRSLGTLLAACIVPLTAAAGLVLLTFKDDKNFMRILRESASSITMALVLEALAGQYLSVAAPRLADRLNLLIVYPPLITSLGGLGSALGSIATTRFHSEWSEVSGFREILREGGSEVAATFLTGVALFLIIAALGGGFVNPCLLGVVFLSGVMALTMILPTSYLLAFFTFKIGLDPDDYVNPVISSLSDLVMTVCLFSTGLFLVGY
mgnify:CR=1 FL=1